MADPLTSEQKEHWSDRWLRVGEACIVLSITSATLLLIVYGVGWLTFCVQKSRETKLQDLAKELSNDWKVLLVLLIPLFYRTVRSFIDRMEEGPFGTKAPLREVGQRRPAKKPEQQQEQEGEE